MIDWTEYRRRLELRDRRRVEVRQRLGWSDDPGRGVPHHQGRNKAKKNAPTAMPPSHSNRIWES